MAVSSYVGSFTTNTVTGQQAVTGLGFTPKVVIFWATYMEAVGSNNEVRSTFGCAASSSSEWTTSAYHNQAGLLSGSVFTSTRCFRIMTSAGTSVVSAQYVSHDADGFTFDITVTSGASATINFMALGGTSISAVTGTFEVPTTSGAVTVSGLAISPKATLFAFGPIINTSTTVADAMLGVGWGISPSQQVASNFRGSISGSTNTAYQVQSTALCMVRTNNSGVADLTGTYSSSGTSFTVDVTHTSSAAFTVGYLCLGGSAGYSSFRFNEPTATGVRQYTSVGVTPQAILFMTNSRAADSGVQNIMNRSIGAAAVNTVVSGGSGGEYDPPPNRIFYEQWDTTLTTFGSGVDARPNTLVSTAQQSSGTSSMRVAYVGGTNGSDRVIYNHPVSAMQIATHSFDVYFDTAFDFARGGKMHGLGPTNNTAGGNTVPADGWSARIMWHNEGFVQTYLYHQDMGGTYGTAKRHPTFQFQKGRWYAVSFIVKVNDFGQYNGYAQIWVDGVMLVDHTGIRFRNVDTGASLINLVTFNTFHGGNDSSWAPLDSNGNITTVYAYYDNHSAMPGEWVKVAPGSGGSSGTTTTTLQNRFDGLYNPPGAVSASFPVARRSQVACIGSSATVNNTSSAIAILTATGSDSFTLDWTRVSGNQSEIVTLAIGDPTSVVVSAIGIGATTGVGSVTHSIKGSTTITGTEATSALGTATAEGFVGAIGVQVDLSGLQSTGHLGTIEQAANAGHEAEGFELTATLGEAAFKEHMYVDFLVMRQMQMAPLAGLVTTTSRFGLMGDWNPDDGLPTDGSSGWLSQTPPRGA